MADVLHVDIETYSELDLKKVGSAVYFAHPSTVVLCAAWALNDGPIESWDIRSPLTWGQCWATVMGVAISITTPAIEVHAWNAGGFEAVEPVLHRHIAPPSWRCTMVRAAYHGLPLSLEHAADALMLGVKKDMAGRRLMLQMAKPRKGAEPWHVTNPEKLDTLVAYCKQDVEVERDVGRQLPELPQSEQDLWLLDHLMMRRGLPVSLTSIDTLTSIAEQELLRLNREMVAATGGAVPSVNAVSALLKWCYDAFNNHSIGPSTEHVKLLPSLDKASIEAYLSGATNQPRRLGIPWILPRNVAAALKIRQEAAKASVAKLTSMKASRSGDGTIKFLTQFYGASRTGRWSGRLAQIQNFPRPAKGLDPAKEIVLMAGGLPYAPPTGHTTLGVVSSCLRGCFQAPAGRAFVVGDFSQIEARVIAWLAGQRDALEVFARGEDIYTYTASKLGSQDRQFGKVLVLACGFGMGAGKFKDTAATYGIALTDVEADNAVKGWRAANPGIAAFWRQCESAARTVLEGNNKIATAGGGKIAFAMGSRKLAGCLLIKLPSGRVLVYRRARLVPGKPGWPEQIAYDGVNQTTRKWETQTTYGGKLAENITQAVARDLLARVIDRLSTDSVLDARVTVHDELVCLVHQNDANAGVNKLHHAMTLPPAWAQGLPVAADVKSMSVYGKG